MDERNHIALVADLVKECENYRDELSADRIKANEYYDGTMNDTLPDKGRSSVVARDVRETVKKVLPSLTRVFLGSSNIVEFDPAKPEDEEGAKQASDYINNVILLESGGKKAIKAVIHDALKLRNGVLTWWYDEKKSVKVSKHTGLDENAFATMVAEEGVDVLEHTARVEVTDGVGMPVHDFKIRRTITERCARVAALPLEEFLIHPDALDEDGAVCIGSKRRLRRTDLVAMGYDKEQVDKLPALGGEGLYDEAEEMSRRGLVEGARTDIPRELQEIDYYEMFVRIDQDGDGIAELRRMCFGGKIAETCLLDDEEADDIPFAIVAAEFKPHQWEGVSIFDDIGDIQRIDTVLLRQTLDNLYWQNMPQLAVRGDLITDESKKAVTEPQFGQAIILKPGATAAEAIQPIQVPFVAKESFAMLSYLDGKKEDRTGITDASGGLEPDALQNVTAKASALLEQQGISQAGMMAETIADGLRRMFRGLLRLITKHQDKPRTVRLRNDWVNFDPRQWNADMDCRVNTGLGAGTRERDLAMITNVLAVQEKILANYGPDNPYVTPEHLGNTLSKLAEAAGLKNPETFFGNPDKEQVQAMLESIRNKPNPEAEKIKAQVQAQIEMKKMDVEASKQKEIAQSQAAVEETIARTRIEAQDKDQDRALKKYEIDTKAQLELLKMQKQQEFDRESAKTAREHDARVQGMDFDEEGKPYDKANKGMADMMQALMQHMQMQMDENRKPRVVTTPDGETFTMGTMN